MKNLKPILFILAVLVLTAATVYPQRKFSGRVLEVIDGKTVVIEAPAGRITAVLQFIEIPEPEQLLRQTVKDHLTGLVLNKIVEFNPRVVMRDRTIGQVYLNGVDVSQQMLRDGAAWHMPLEDSGQDSSEAGVYNDNQSQAKAEKRGVWGVPDLKPAWEYRYKLAVIARKREEAELERVKLEARRQANRPGPPRPAESTNRRQAGQTEMWANVGEMNAMDQPIGLGGLMGGYDPASRIGHISTPSVYLDFPTGDFVKKIESRIFYFYKGDKTNVEDSVIFVGFLAVSQSYKFATNNRLAIKLDKQTLTFEKPRRYTYKGEGVTREVMFYKFTRAQLQKIVNSRTLSIQIGSYRGSLSPESIEYINNLISIT